MMKRKRILAALLTLCMVLALMPAMLSAATISQWEDVADLTRITENNIRIYTLYEASNGTLYAGTSRGVWSYNGTDWEDISAGLTGNALSVNTIYEASDGTLYAGTANGMWAYGDTYWEDISIKSANNQIDPPNLVRVIFEAANGTLWVGAWGGVWTFDGTSWGNVSAGLTPTSFNVNALNEASDGTLYAGTWRDVWAYDGKDWKNMSAGLADSALYVRVMFMAKDGTLYVGTQASGVWAYDGKDWENISVTLSDRALSITALYESANGTLYVGTDYGAWVYDGTARERVSDGLSGAALFVNTLHETETGTLYAGTDGGLRKSAVGIPIFGKPTNAPSSWAAEQVNAAIAAGHVPTSLQSKYSSAATRAEFCALAVAFYEKVIGNEITERKIFNDTSDINVQKMGALGVVSGVGNDNFAPNQTLTREQAAVILSNLANAMNKPLPDAPATFADNSSVASWAITQAGRIQAAGVMSGTGNNMFSPKDDYTREQCIVTIMRLAEVVK